MHLALLQRQLLRELPTYAAALARARDPRLALPGTLALADALCDCRHETFAERDALVVAVIAEHRARPHPLWPAALTLAFLPMLARLRRRIRTSAPEELEQALLVAFLESIERVALRGNMAARLRSATCRAVFRALGREQRVQMRTMALRGELRQDGSFTRHCHRPLESTEQADCIRITEARRPHAAPAPELAPPQRAA